jgi:hypothetical protein
MLGFDHIGNEFVIGPREQQVGSWQGKSKAG